MRKLADNVKKIHAQRVKEKRSWIKAVNHAIDIRSGKEKEMMILANALSGSMVADPHCHLDLMVKLADWLDAHYSFFVPDPFVYAYPIPKKYGGYGGKALDYVSLRRNLCGIESFDKITEYLSSLMEHMKYMSIQSIGVIEKEINGDRFEEFFVRGVDFSPDWSTKKIRKDWKKL